jgi:hypothetical protein
MESMTLSDPSVTLVHVLSAVDNPGSLEQVHTAASAVFSILPSHPLSASALDPGSDTLLPQRAEQYLKCLAKIGEGVHEVIVYAARF